MRTKPIILLMLIIGLLAPLATPARGYGLSLALVNQCTAEEHVGAAGITCTLNVTAGNVVVATGVGAGTNAACSQNPILGINSFNFDQGALLTNYHGANKLSIEIYDSGVLSSSSSLSITLSGMCILQFASLVAYQFSGVSAVSVSASVNTCSGSVLAGTTLTCSLTALPGTGWLVGHGAGDCTACSFTNQASTFQQASSTNFTDYMGVVKSVSPGSNAFTLTNGSNFNGGVSALEIVGTISQPPSQQAGSFLPAFAAIILWGLSIAILRSGELTFAQKAELATVTFIAGAIVLVALVVAGF